MSYPRSLLAFAAGLGLCVTACTGEEVDTDLDLEPDSDMLPQGVGSGLNGADPAVVGPCLRGAMNAAAAVQGAEPGHPGDANSQLQYYGCDGTIYTPSAPYNPAIHQPSAAPITIGTGAVPSSDVIATMVWAGAGEAQNIQNVQGNGFLLKPPPANPADPRRGVDWAVTAVPAYSTYAFAELMLAKFNPMAAVELTLRGDAVASEHYFSPDLILESVIVASVLPGGGLNIRVFRADLPEKECNDPSTYYNMRYCHNNDPASGTSVCFGDIRVHPASDVGLYCLDSQGNAATNLEDEGITCGGVPALQVWVKPGSLKNAGYPCAG